MLAGLPTHLRLEHPLGAGGSGEVWVARDRRSGTDVALKVVPLDRSRGAARLAAEARALARLRGLPGVAAVHEVGSDGAGHGWLTSELVAGPTLAARVRATGPLDGPQATGLVGRVAATLAAAHAAGVVHGDVTPSNVVLHPERGPVLVDWGLAGLGDAGAAADRALTPQYASPERRRGRPAAAPGDVYAAGACGVWALSGRDPDPGAVVARVGDDLADPPASWLRRALVVDPRRRPSAAELAAGLGVAVVAAGVAGGGERAGRRPAGGWPRWGRSRRRR